MTSVPLLSPARYAAPSVMSFANQTGDADIVSAANPLPVATAPLAAASPLTGTTGTSAMLGPFQPVPGRAIMLSLAGTWTGQIRLMRSVDGGATIMSLTALGQAYGTYTGNICEPVWEESEIGAQIYLDATITAGSLSYRMGQ